MSESAAGAPPAAQGTAPQAANAEPAKAGAPNGETAQTAEDLIELALEEGKPPVKVPRSKLDPHLAKYRSETDKLRSEYDKNSKTLSERTQKLEAVLRAAKEDTDGTLRELGIDPEEYAERKLSARIKAAMREAEEKDNPEKKVSRERDEELEALRKKVADSEKTQLSAQREAMMGRLRAAVGAAVSKLPEALRADATPDVIAVFRQALAQGKDITIEDAARAALTVMRARAKNAYGADEELRKGLAPPAPPPKKPEHPASRPANRTPDGKFIKMDDDNGAGEVLRAMQRGKF